MQLRLQRTEVAVEVTLTPAGLLVLAQVDRLGNAFDLEALGLEPRGEVFRQRFEIVGAPTRHCSAKRVVHCSIDPQFNQALVASERKARWRHGGHGNADHRLCICPELRVQPYRVLIVGAARKGGNGKEYQEQQAGNAIVHG
ncbi:hypothetical protein [Pseudomonas sp.]|uniref:hypothetical protein n=1 Tax=Pseudomonas sp. TaxID=306 RepID=UPI002584CEA9|nr:hypothetical protein [Pseudomonas sp.]